MDLGSFIIKPIQRICKYPLLLQSIVDHTPKDHFDYENLLAAVAKAVSYTHLTLPTIYSV